MRAALTHPQFLAAEPSAHDHLASLSKLARRPRPCHRRRRREGNCARGETVTERRQNGRWVNHINVYQTRASQPANSVEIIARRHWQQWQTGRSQHSEQCKDPSRQSIYNNRIVNLASGVAYVGGRTGECGRRRRARMDDGRIPAVGRSRGRGRRRASQTRDVTPGCGLRGRTDGRVKPSRCRAAWLLVLFITHDLDSKINGFPGLIVEHIKTHVKFADPSSISFWDIMRNNRQTDKWR